MLQSLVSSMKGTGLIGVDLGSRAVKLVELSRDGGRLVLVRALAAPVDGGKPPAEALRTLCAKAKLAGRQAAVGIASPEAIVRPFEFPAMPKKELVSAIRLEAEQAILNGHTIEEMAVDWSLTEGQPGASVRGVVAVVPNEILDASLGAASDAGLVPMVADVGGLALWNAFATLAADKVPAEGTVMLVHAGARTTQLIIVGAGRQLRLQRDIALGFAAWEQGQQSDWLVEIGDSLNYARAHAGVRELDAAYLSGGGATAAAVDHLSGALQNVPVTLWNPIANLVRDPSCPPVDDGAGPLFAVAAGLALRTPS